MKKRARKTAGKRPSLRAVDAPGSELPAETVFCTVCGATLENFCLSSAADDLEAIRRTLAQCREQGRFSGDFCSKLFIAHPEAFTPQEENTARTRRR